jgi:hypothetical protein
MKTQWINRVCLSLFCLTLLASCTRYQYATVSSPLKQNFKREFVRENDSVRIEYSFNGTGGPVQITIHNKLDTPIFINWRMSSLIIAGKSNPYFKNESEFRGSGATTNLQWTESFSTSNTNISGSIKRDEDVSFIPPGRHITTIPVRLRDHFFERPFNQKPARKSYSTLSGASSGRSTLYAQNNSPLRYESYLSYSTDANFATIVAIEDAFWVSEVLDSYDNPDNILNMHDRKADTFYNSKMTGFGGAMALLGIIVLAAFTVEEAEQ